MQPIKLKKNSEGTFKDSEKLSPLYSLIIVEDFPINPKNLESSLQRESKNLVKLLGIAPVRSITSVFYDTAITSISKSRCSAAFQFYEKRD